MPLKANETSCELDHSRCEKVIGKDGSLARDSDMSE